MLTFTYAKTNRFPTIVVNEEEEETVNKVLPMFTTKKQAIEYLVKRGWSTKMICQKITYDDGRDLREQHVNQVKQKIVKK
jgi:hypothetical protein